MERQLDKYITDNLQSCLGNFDEYRRTGCDIEVMGNPEVTSNIAAEDVFFVGKFPLRALCGAQTFTIEDYYISMPINLRRIYELGTRIMFVQRDYRVLEAATQTIINTYSGLDSTKLPPPGEFQIGPISTSVYWIKNRVSNLLRSLISSNLPLMQVFGARNYEYIEAPADVRDPELYELIHNRQWLIPLGDIYPEYDVRFSYFEWWNPYFELNCR